MGEVPVGNENPEKASKPEQRINFIVPIEGGKGGIEFHTGNKLAIRASNLLDGIRLIGDSLGEQEKRRILAKVISLDPRHGEYGSLEYNAWLIAAMGDGEREIALRHVDDETKELLFKTRDEVVAREKAFQDQVEAAALDAQPQLDQLSQQIRDRIQDIKNE